MRNNFLEKTLQLWKGFQELENKITWNHEVSANKGKKSPELREGTQDEQIFTNYASENINMWIT